MTIIFFFLKLMLLTYNCCLIKQVSIENVVKVFAIKRKYNTKYRWKYTLWSMNSLLTVEKLNLAIVYWFTDLFNIFDGDIDSGNKVHPQHNLYGLVNVLVGRDAIQSDLEKIER